MFLDFYNLREQPFGVTPDSRFLYMGPEHREALASLLYTVRMGRGFHALIAPPGMGKTTLLFHLLDHLKPTSRSAFLFQTQCDKHEFLRYLMADIGLEVADNDYVRMHSALNQFLVRNAEEGKQFILVIDEAQNLSDEVLEAVRLLSDFETSRRKLMHIILAGQPQLARKLFRPNLVQLRQRISLISQMKPMDGPEVRRYIEHRLQKADYTGGPLFSSEALALIARHSEGIPRNINNICFSALSLGFANDKKTIDANIVKEIIASRTMEDLPNSRPDGLADSYQSLPTPALNHNASRATERVKLPGSVKFPVSSGLPLVSRAKRASAYLTAVIVLGGVLLAWPNSVPGLRNGTAEVSIASSGLVREALPQPEIVTGTINLQPLEKDGAAAESEHEIAGAGPAVGQTVIVRPNDTLWGISESYLGRVNDPILEQILQLNDDLGDPHLLKAGQRIRLPALAVVDQGHDSGVQIAKSVRNEERGKP
jgi:type II secretory pathway predicted ATPase ExeA